MHRGTTQDGHDAAVGVGVEPAGAGTAENHSPAVVDAAEPVGLAAKSAGKGG